MPTGGDGVLQPNNTFSIISANLSPSPDGEKKEAHAEDAGSPIPAPPSPSPSPPATQRPPGFAAGGKISPPNNANSLTPTTAVVTVLPLGPHQRSVSPPSTPPPLLSSILESQSHLRSAHPSLRLGAAAAAAVAAISEAELAGRRRESVVTLADQILLLHSPMHLATQERQVSFTPALSTGSGEAGANTTTTGEGGEGSVILPEPQLVMLDHEGVALNVPVEPSTSPPQKRYRDARARRRRSSTVKAKKSSASNASGEAGKGGATASPKGSTNKGEGESSSTSSASVSATLTEPKVKA